MRNMWRAILAKRMTPAALWLTTCFPESHRHTTVHQESHAHAFAQSVDPIHRVSSCVRSSGEGITERRCIGRERNGRQRRTPGVYLTHGTQLRGEGEYDG